MENKIDGRNVAILITDGFEQVELTKPLDALKEAGASVDIVSPKEDTVRGWKFTDWGDEVDVDVHLSGVTAGDYDALVLPGGVMNPDHLRMDAAAVQFTQSFFEQHKPVASICHGPWTLIEADVVEGRRMTSYRSLKTDLINAGAEWVDEEVVVDEGLVTSRNPDDLPAFCDKMIEEISEGEHRLQTA